ncbi:MAG TPA: hypothetical protein ACFYEK_15255 [Candidatus Wunengus sp. YC60]|uniref:hypothetical protein n=1 Tax=Candidatus Wunengus sp. YC60 TaxID=3367697 RepID=UPI00402985ED
MKKVIVLFMSVFIVLAVCGISKADLNPGTYGITIRPKDYSNYDGRYIYYHDEWIFSEDGTFESKHIGIKGSYENTANGSFKINIKQKKLDDLITSSMFGFGLNSSDVNVSIKSLEIYGNTKGYFIQGNMELQFKLSLKRPLKTNITTKGRLQFVSGSYRKE